MVTVVSLHDIAPMLPDSPRHLPVAGPMTSGWVRGYNNQATVIRYQIPRILVFPAKYKHRLSINTQLSILYDDVNAQKIRSCKTFSESLILTTTSFASIPHSFLPFLTYICPEGSRLALHSFWYNTDAVSRKVNIWFTGTCVVDDCVWLFSFIKQMINLEINAMNNNKEYWEQSHIRSCVT